MSRTLVIFVFAAFVVVGLLVLGAAVDDVQTNPNSSANDTTVTAFEETGPTLYATIGGGMTLVLVLGLFYAYGRQGF